MSGRSARHCGTYPNDWSAFMTYARAQELTARRGFRRLHRNTTLERRGDAFAICLHQTDVVTIRSDGTYVLRNGGWQTTTTKRRINQYSPARIYQKDFVWYVATAEGEVEFTEGMEVRG